MTKNFYISTSIAYVNGEPHLGFAMESIIADSIARFQRLEGKDVFFVTGTDEHGIKIFKTAQAQGITPNELCDKNSAKFRELKGSLNLSNDFFIRTSDKQVHWPTVQWLWEKLEKKGDIYKQSYEGLYCEGCEAFVAKKDLENGKCVIHKKEPSSIAEENYFFRLSKYSDQILDVLKNEKVKVVPSYRKNEILALLEGEGLKDVSFSRPTNILPWGVPVPGDESQNMYVWCDALTNYISALDAKEYYKDSDSRRSLSRTGCGDGNDTICHSGLDPESIPFKKYWINAKKIHCIGKDIVRFHAGIWLGMLLSAGVDLPDYIHIHGFLTSEGQKMSKSIGNVVDPFEYVDRYGVDALRYYLLREVPTGGDADFSKSHFEKIYNAHLANGLGNLVNRIAVMSQKNGIKPGKAGFEYSENVIEEIVSAWHNVGQAMNEFDTNKALLEAWKLIDLGNKEMDNFKPWMIKDDNEKLSNIMKMFMELLRHIAYLLSPFLPNTSERIFGILNVEKLDDIEKAKEWNAQSSEWKELGKAEILFMRIEK